MRGKGVAAAVKEAVRLAQAAGIPVKLNAVMSQESAPDLEDLVRLAAALDVSLTINVVRTGNKRLWHKAGSIAQDREATRRLLEKLAAMAKDNPRMLFSPQTYRFAATWPDYGRDRLHEGDPEAEGLTGAPRCHAGRSFLSIAPDGTVHPCPLTAGEISGGNAVSDGLERSWRALGGHRCGFCYTPCMVEQNYLHSLNLGVIGRFLRRHVLRYS